MNKFRTFLESLESPSNAPLIEAISTGYKVLFESFYKAMEINTASSGLVYTEFYINPTANEINRIKRESKYKTVKGFINHDTKDIFVWDATNIIHMIAANALGMDLNNITTFYHQSGSVVNIHPNYNGTDITEYFTAFKKMFPETTGVEQQINDRFKVTEYDQVQKPALTPATV